MTYVGQQPSTTFDSGIQDRFTGLTTSYVTLTHDISAETDILVVWNNIVQDSGTYSVGGTGNKTLTLGGTLSSGDVVTVYYTNKVMQSVNPTAGSVNTTQLADLGISTAKIQTDAVSQAKIADEAIDEARMQISNAPTNGYMLTAQSGNTGGLTWAEAGGGVWELLQSIDASSTATVDFTYDFPTDYNNYVIYFNDLGLASNGYLAFRAQVGGNSGVRDGGNDYGGARYGRRTNGDNASTDLGTGDGNYSMININNGQGVFSGDWNAQGYLWIMNPNDDHYKYFQYNANYGTSGNNINNISGGGVMYQNGNLSRVQFMNEDGHNMSGKFRLYGLKNA